MDNDLRDKIMVEIKESLMLFFDDKITTMDEWNMTLEECAAYLWGMIDLAHNVGVLSKLQRESAYVRLRPYFACNKLLDSEGDLGEWWK